MVATPSPSTFWSNAVGTSWKFLSFQGPLITAWGWLDLSFLVWNSLLLGPLRSPFLDKPFILEHRKESMENILGLFSPYGVCFTYHLSRECLASCQRWSNWSSGLLSNLEIFWVGLVGYFSVILFSQLAPLSSCMCLKRGALNLCFPVAAPISSCSKFSRWMC